MQLVQPKIISTQQGRRRRDSWGGCDCPSFSLFSANVLKHIILKGAVLLLTVALKSLLLATSHVGQMA